MKNSWKCWGFVRIEFLDRNLTFRIVCNRRNNSRKLSQFLHCMGSSEERTRAIRLYPTSLFFCKVLHHEKSYKIHNTWLVPRHFVAPSLTEFVMLGILNFIKIGFYHLTKVLEKALLPSVRGRANYSGIFMTLLFS